MPDSWWLKRDRAIQHLEELERVLALPEGPGHTLRREPDPDGLSERFHIEGLHPIPPEADAILGDAVHNLRSALDHLAVALSTANGGDPDDTSISFPIFREPEGFHETDAKGNFTHRSGMHKIRTLAPEAQAFVERFQPFLRDQNHVMFWPLWDLLGLDNRDKHRALNLCYFETTAIGSVGAYVPPGVHLNLVKGGPLANGDHVITVAYPAGYLGRKVEPAMSAAVSVQRFSGNKDGFLPVDNIKTAVLAVVEKVLSEATPFL